KSRTVRGLRINEYEPVKLRRHVDCNLGRSAPLLDSLGDRRAKQVTLAGFVAHDSAPRTCEGINVPEFWEVPLQSCSTSLQVVLDDPKLEFRMRAAELMG